MTKNKYEYYILHKDLCANNFDEEEFLNERGKEGWKLVSVVATTNGKPILYFRRKKAERKISLRKKVKRTDVPKQLKEVIEETQLSREIIKERITQIIVDKLGCDESEVTENANLVDDLGCDSLDAVELLMEFEKEFSVGIPDEQAEKVRTFGDAVDILYNLVNRK